MDDARQLIEDKQREIEDNALDLLDAAAGGEVDSAIGGADAPDSALPEIDKTATSFDPPTKSGSPKQANHETLRHSPWRLRAR